MSSREQRMLDCIVEFRDLHGYPPTVREIGEAMDIPSPATVHQILSNLEASGRIVKVARSPRAIRVVTDDDADASVRSAM